MFCRQCGFELADNDLFCAKCGARVVGIDDCSTDDLPSKSQSEQSEQSNNSPEAVLKGSIGPAQENNDTNSSQTTISVKSVLVKIKPLLILIGVFAIFALVIVWVKRASDASNEKFLEEYKDKEIVKGNIEESKEESVLEAGTPNDSNEDVSNDNQEENNSSVSGSYVTSVDNYPLLGISSDNLGKYLNINAGGYHFTDARGIVYDYQGFTLDDGVEFYKCIETGEYFGIDSQGQIIAYSGELRNGTITLAQFMGLDKSEWSSIPEPKLIDGPSGFKYATWKMLNGYLLVGVMNNPSVSIEDALVMSHYCEVSKIDSNKFLLWDSMETVSSGEDRENNSSKGNDLNNPEPDIKKTGAIIKSPLDVIPCSTRNEDLSSKGHSEYKLEDVYDEGDCIASAKTYFDTCGYNAIQKNTGDELTIAFYDLYDGDKQIATAELYYLYGKDSPVYLIINVN